MNSKQTAVLAFAALMTQVQPGLTAGSAKELQKMAGNVAVSAPQAGAQTLSDDMLAGINPGIESAAYAFTSKYQVVIKDGKLFMRAHGETAWNPVPNQPAPVYAISADGDNLIGIGKDASIYYMKFTGFKWIPKWGKPLSKVLKLPANRSWGIAHKGPEVGGYEDAAGNFKAISAGVTTLYLLTKDGRHLRYADPWLPADFEHRISMPLKGRFIAEAMSVSGSTMFLIGKSGRMFTRMADFDTTGADPALAYTFNKPNNKVIALPPEGWREQPAISGKITANITITNTGRGNAARELHVEGVDAQGNGGYYSKAIYGDSWTFVKTGTPVTGPFIGAGEDTGAEVEADYPVVYKSFRHRYLPEGSLIRFSPETDDAEITVNLASGRVVKLPVYIREAFFTRKKGTHKLFGTIVTPDDIINSSEPDTAAFVTEFLRGKKLLDVHVFFNGKAVKLESAPWRQFRENISQHLAKSADKKAAKAAAKAARQAGKDTAE